MEDRAGPDPKGSSPAWVSGRRLGTVTVARAASPSAEPEVSLRPSEMSDKREPIVVSRVRWRKRPQSWGSLTRVRGLA